MIVFFLCALLVWNYALGDLAKTKINTLSQEEKEDLEFFFRSCISSDTFGYVLFGDKPMAIATFVREEEWCRPRFFLNPQAPQFDHTAYDFIYASFAMLCRDNSKPRKGFKVWEKYRSSFPSKKFLLVKCNKPSDNEIEHILLINKEAFLRTIESNLNDFRTILGDHLTPDILLQEVREKRDLFIDILKENTFLLGILFGYGKHNAELFHKNQRLQLQPFSENNFPLNSMMIQLPTFVADQSSEETKYLKWKYQNQRSKILEKYQSNDFLEVTLSRLTED